MFMLIFALLRQVAGADAKLRSFTCPLTPLVRDRPVELAAGTSSLTFVTLVSEARGRVSPDEEAEDDI